MALVLVRRRRSQDLPPHRVAVCSASHHRHHRQPTNRPRGSRKTVVRRSSFVSQWRGNVLRGSNLAPPTVYLPFEHAEVTNPLALSHHTIVFPGESLGTLDSFLLALREVPQEQWTDVVVLSPDINAFMWHRINMFPRVYWYRGTPLSHSDLVRVAVTRAQAVVIMADPTPVGADGGTSPVASDPAACLRARWHGCRLG